MTMTKRELVTEVANKLGMPQSEAARVIDEALATITSTLAEGQRCEFRGFGIFETKTRASRVGRNPRTGEQVPIPQRRIVTFRPGKKLRALLAEPHPAEDKCHDEAKADQPS